MCSILQLPVPRLLAKSYMYGRVPMVDCSGSKMMLLLRVSKDMFHPTCTTYSTLSRFRPEALWPLDIWRLASSVGAYDEVKYIAHAMHWRCSVWIRAMTYNNRYITQHLIQILAAR